MDSATASVIAASVAAVATVAAAWIANRSKAAPDPATLDDRASLKPNSLSRFWRKKNAVVAVGVLGSSVLAALGIWAALTFYTASSPVCAQTGPGESIQAHPPCTNALTDDEERS
jgi:hypothetical protein